MQITFVDATEFPHASNALAYLMGGGQVVFHDTDDVETEIMNFIPKVPDAVADAQPEPEPQPAKPALAPTAVAAAGGWPAEFTELVGIPTFSSCLTGLWVDSLDSFAENIDLEDENHDAILRAELAALPDKPKKARQLRNRAQKTLDDLVLRLRLFEEFDGDGDGSLSRVGCMWIPIEKMQPRGGGGGGTIGDHFDAIDTDRDGLISFADLFAHAEVTEGEAVPPEAGTTVAAAAAAAVAQATEAQRRAEEDAASLALARRLQEEEQEQEEGRRRQAALAAAAQEPVPAAVAAAPAAPAAAVGDAAAGGGNTVVTNEPELRAAVKNGGVETVVVQAGARIELTGSDMDITRALWLVGAGRRGRCLARNFRGGGAKHALDTR